MTFDKEMQEYDSYLQHLTDNGLKRELIVNLRVIALELKKQNNSD